jgi:serine/threonine protein kinase
MSVSPVCRAIPCLDLQVRSLDGTEVQHFTETKQKFPTEIHQVQLDFTPLNQAYGNCATYLDQAIRKIIIPIIWSLIETEKSQKYQIKFGKYSRSFTIQARFVGKEIQVLLSDFLKRGSKNICKVFHLAGPRLENQPPGNIFIYEKYLDLKEKRAKIEKLERTIKEFVAANKPKEEMLALQKTKQEAQDAYGEIVGKLIKETEISHRVPDAVKSWIVTHIKDPSSPKALIMEFVDSSSFLLFDFPIIDQRLDPINLKQKVLLAIRLCQDLAQMHKAGYVSMDLKVSHLLLKKDIQGELCLKLIDFGLCAKTGTFTNAIRSDYAFLPEIPFVDPDSFGELTPHIATPAMDAFVLGFVIGRLVYGTDALLQYKIRRLYHKQTLWESLKNLMWKPRLFEELRDLVQKELGTYLPIDEVLCHLWDQDPVTRWTPEQAAEALQKFSTET